MKKTQDDTSLLIKATKAMRKAVENVIAERKLRGQPLIIWRNGKVVKVLAREL